MSTPHLAPGAAPEARSAPSAASHKKRRLWRIVLVVLGVLLLVRIALPYVLLHFANQRLAALPTYQGHIADLDLALIRGAYRIESFYLDKKDSLTQARTPFMSAEVIDLSVEWRALFEGALVGELVIEHPELRFTKDAAEPAAVQKDTADLRSLLNDFMPLSVNRVEINNGVIRYKDGGSSPPVDVQVDAIEALAFNLINTADSTTLLPASIKATAQVYGGDLKFTMGLDPLAKTTLFDMNVELVHTDLTRINDLFKAYGNFDVNKGTFGLYAEMATRDGAFDGYVKPVIKDLDVLGKDDREDNLFRKLWEGIVGTAGALLTNPKKDQVATKVTFKGRLDDPKVGTWSAIAKVVSNAFIEALPPALDHEIDIATVGEEGPDEKKGLLQRVFGKKDKK
ncbi:MAG: DUF748 domain-containing protein [Flavobacteriales bacterium]|nr:DUF748 domain-containing protein [Flavobacteriales bacterium]MBK9077434.1 DUF748 domain-containing protein [Flavobacteriales bacterium]MBK9539040.1 DUF748 domain-containing protein [Flavobacteriales bacterium]